MNMENKTANGRERERGDIKNYIATPGNEKITQNLSNRSIIVLMNGCRSECKVVQAQTNQKGIFQKAFMASTMQQRIAPEQATPTTQLNEE